MLKFRGNMPAPKHNHGDVLIRGGQAIGVVQHRRWTGRSWEYGLLVEGSVMTLWINE